MKGRAYHWTGLLRKEGPWREVHNGGVASQRAGESWRARPLIGQSFGRAGPVTGCDLGGRVLLCGRDLWLDKKAKRRSLRMWSLSRAKIFLQTTQGSRGRKDRYRATYHKNRFNWVLTD